MKSYKIKDEYGIFYYKDEECTILHREDGPAKEHFNGTKYWFINGKCHREDGHAAEYASGTKKWYKNGICHREDGPAIEWDYGGKSYFLNDKQYSEEDYWAIIRFGGFA